MSTRPGITVRSLASIQPVGAVRLDGGDAVAADDDVDVVAQRVGVAVPESPGVHHRGLRRLRQAPLQSPGQLARCGRGALRVQRTHPQPPVRQVQQRAAVGREAERVRGVVTERLGFALQRAVGCDRRTPRRAAQRVDEVAAVG